MSLVLNVEILGEFKKLTSATEGAAKDLKGLNGTVGKISKGMKTALGAIGVGFSLGVVIDQLKQASQAAIEDAQSQELLANQLRNSTNATDDQIAAVEKAIGQMQLQAAVADDELRPAFAKLTRATGDTEESTKMLQLALDISAGSGKSLDTVTTALTKAYNGQFSALTKLGVPMNDQILNAREAVKAQTAVNKALEEQQVALTQFGIDSEEYAKATAKLTEKQGIYNAIVADGVDWQGQLAEAFGGSADAAANTDPYQRMNILFGELQEQIGAALLPYLQEFSQWLAEPGTTDMIQQIVDIIVEAIKQFGNLISLVVKYRDVVIPLTVAVGALTAGLKLYTAVMSVVAARNAAVTASNVALAASNTAVATTATTARGALALFAAAAGTAAAAAATVGTILTIPGSSALPGTVPSTTRPGGIAPMPVFPNQPQTGIPGFGGPAPTRPPSTGGARPNVTVTQSFTVNTPSTSASAVVSSLQGFQSQTGADLRNLLR